MEWARMRPSWTLAHVACREGPGEILLGLEFLQLRRLFQTAGQAVKTSNRCQVWWPWLELSEGRCRRQSIDSNNNRHLRWMRAQRLCIAALWPCFNIMV